MIKKIITTLVISSLAACASVPEREDRLLTPAGMPNDVAVNHAKECKLYSEDPAFRNYHRANYIHCMKKAGFEFRHASMPD